MRQNDLITACQKGNLKLVKQLLDKGADVNSPSDYGYTSLHAACRKGNFETVKLLLGRGAWLNPQNEIGNTPLYYATNKLIVTELLKYKDLDINIQNNDDRSVLYYLSKYDVEQAKEIVDLIVRDERFEFKDALHNLCRPMSAGNSFLGSFHSLNLILSNPKIKDLIKYNELPESCYALPKDCSLAKESAQVIPFLILMSYCGVEIKCDEEVIKNFNIRFTYHNVIEVLHYYMKMDAGGDLAKEEVGQIKGQIKDTDTIQSFIRKICKLHNIATEKNDEEPSLLGYHTAENIANHLTTDEEAIGNLMGELSDEGLVCWHSSAKSALKLTDVG